MSKGRSNAYKIRDMLNAKDPVYGCRGDGATNDTVAIQAAANDAIANDATLFVPNGNFIYDGLSVDGPCDIVGVRQSWATGLPGTELHYTGSGNAIEINIGGTGPIYRVNMRDFGIFFSQNATSGIAVYQLQESSFENIGINGTGYTVTYGFDLDSLSISHIDRCVIQKVTTAINTHYDATPIATGSSSITRCNIFDVTTVLDCGYVLGLLFENNWVEAFQTAIAIKNNGAGAQGSQVIPIVVNENTFLQSQTGLAETRVVKVTSDDNTKPVRLRLKFTKNKCSMIGGTATKPSYAISFDLAGNASIVDVLAEIENNWFYGVTTAGIYSDTTWPIITENGNETLDDLVGTGSALPNFAGSGTRLGSARVLDQSAVAVSCAADVTEDILATITVPAKLLGKNGQLRITTQWSYNNNANTKYLRVRFGGIGGTVYMITAPTVQLGFQAVTTIANRAATNSQVGGSQGMTDTGVVVATGKTTSAVNTLGSTTIVITGQKTVAGDTITLESYIVEIIPKG